MPTINRQPDQEAVEPKLVARESIEGGAGLKGALDRMQEEAAQQQRLRQELQEKYPHLFRDE